MTDTPPTLLSSQSSPRTPQTEQTVASARESISDVLKNSPALLPLYEEFVSSRCALSQLAESTNAKDVVLTALQQGLEILCNDQRYNDAVIISLDKLS